MFRRRTSSSGKIHYRINIDKSMCPNPVDIYILMEIRINLVLTGLILIYISIRR
jgi:hypothetical protein